MTIKQLSIFLENKSGTLAKVLDLLKQSQVQLIAITIADTAEYGICRIICSEPERACEELKKGGVAVAITDVFAIELDNKPGSGADAIKVFSNSGISIPYLYSFLVGSKAILVLRADNNEQAVNVITNNNLKCITESGLASWG